MYGILKKLYPRTKIIFVKIQDNTLKLTEATQFVIETAKRLPKRTSHLCNYPELVKFRVKFLLKYIDIY